MTPELESYLVKEQTSFGAPEGSLTNSDGLALTPDSKMEVVPEETPIEVLSAGYDQDISIVGAIIRATAQLGLYLQGTNTSTKPDVSRIIRACGFEEIINVTDDVYMYEYKPAHYNTSKDLSVWHYSGGVGSSAALLRKFQNVVGDWKISADTSKPCKFELTSGKAKYVSEAVATPPTITKSSLLIPAVLPVYAMFDPGNVPYNVEKMEFSGGGSCEQYIKCDETDGIGNSEITKKKIKFSFVVSANASLTSPMTALLAGLANRVINIYFGVTGKKIGFTIATGQYIDCKQGASNNLTTWEISGLADANDFLLKFNFAQVRVSDFTYAKTTDLNVQFTDQTATPPDTYDWDFGDGTSHGTDASPAHDYTVAGAGYYVVVMTTVKTGVTSSITRTILVT
jgi:hypothetical protein